MSLKSKCCWVKVRSCRHRQTGVQFYRCTNCGHDTKQHINGSIRYLKLDELDKKWLKANVDNG